jgi:hypothetical protein
VGFGRRKKERPEGEMQIAYCKEGRVCIETASRELFRKISLENRP